MNIEQINPMNDYIEEIVTPDADGDYRMIEENIAVAQEEALKAISDDEFPTGTPERAAEEDRVREEASATVASNFSSTLLGIDELLENPKYAGVLQPRERAGLERTRAKLERLMGIDPDDPTRNTNPSRPFGPPDLTDPKTGKPVPYHRRTPEEYYTTPTVTRGDTSSGDAAPPSTPDETAPPSTPPPPPPSSESPQGYSNTGSAGTNPFEVPPTPPSTT
jgi:hypothetical protein